VKPFYQHFLFWSIPYAKVVFELEAASGDYEGAVVFEHAPAEFF
jgi:hypothetical protein